MRHLQQHKVYVAGHASASCARLSSAATSKKTVTNKVSKTKRSPEQQAPRVSKSQATKLRAPSIPEELRKVRMTHPERVLFPEIGVTKARLALYYAQVAERMLPHVGQRPLMLVRCPEGVGTPCFHQKHPTQGMFETLYVESAGGLVQLVQNGALEIHTWGSRFDDFDRPDQLTFDLDPDEGLPWPRVVEAALDIQRRLEAVELPTFLKTTGGKGLHIVVPITPELSWDEIALPIAWSELTPELRPDQFTLRNVPELLGRAGRSLAGIRQAPTQVDSLRTVRLGEIGFGGRFQPGARVNEMRHR